MPTLGIFTRGDELFGSGHLRRCSWIARAVQLRGAFNSVQIHCLDSAYARRFWGEHRPAAELSWLDAASLRLAQGLPDVALVDWLESAASEVEALGAAGCKPVLLDDHGAAVPHARLVINSLTAGLESSTVQVGRASVHSGAEYVQLDPELSLAASARKAEAWASPPRSSRILISFGGTAQGRLSNMLLKALRRLEFVGEVRVVPASESRTERHGTLRAEYMPAARSLLPDLLWAELLICAGGITLYEAAALGLPAAAIALNAHQSASIAKFTAAGSCADLGSAAGADAAHFERALELVLYGGETRARMSRQGPLVLDGSGLTRTVELIEALAQE